MCGARPATRVSLRFVSTFIVWIRTCGLDGYLCRSCGTAMLRDAQALNLTRGWWGIGVVVMAVYLASNWMTRRTILNQGPPTTRDAAVITPMSHPLPAGRPVLRQPGVWIVLTVVLLVVAGFT